MPADTIGGMSPNVWWIAAGSTKSSSTSARSDPAPGQILMVDMTKSNFSKFFLTLHLIIVVVELSHNWISKSLNCFANAELIFCLQSQVCTFSTLSKLACLPKHLQKIL